MSFGKLDPSELRCCDQQMQPRETPPVFQCVLCGWAVTKVEFLRAFHLPNVTAAITRRELGRQL